MTLMDIPYESIFARLIRQLSKLFALSLFAVVKLFIALNRPAIIMIE